LHIVTKQITVIVQNLVSVLFPQAVRPHAPLIKFPSRQGVPKPNVQELLKTLVVDLQQHSSPSAPPAAAPPQLSQPRVPFTPISGTPDTLASIQLFPARYRRRPLSGDEMEFIQHNTRGTLRYALSHNLGYSSHLQQFWSRHRHCLVIRE
uniref:Uncharacterized protein n=1 Tax=Neogobius melanostomus TaxID=47308 RepID=A0A8C6UW42_9GOBI